jgi:hypothetical protein
MEKHPDWKPLSDEWFLSIVQQGGRTEELIQRLVRVGWFGSDFAARAIDCGRAHEVRRRIKKFRDDRGMPLFFHIEEEIAGKLEHYYSRFAQIWSSSENCGKVSSSLLQRSMISQLLAPSLPGSVIAVCGVPAAESYGHDRAPDPDHGTCR